MNYEFPKVEQKNLSSDGINEVMAIVIVRESLKCSVEEAKTWIKANLETKEIFGGKYSPFEIGRLIAAYYNQS